MRNGTLWSIASGTTMQKALCSGLQLPRSWSHPVSNGSTPRPPRTDSMPPTRSSIQAQELPTLRSATPTAMSRFSRIRIGRGHSMFRPKLFGTTRNCPAAGHAQRDSSRHPAHCSPTTWQQVARPRFHSVPFSTSGPAKLSDRRPLETAPVTGAGRCCARPTNAELVQSANGGSTTVNTAPRRVPSNKS